MKPDDLKRIRAVDAVLETSLNRLGIRRFSEIAAWKPDDVARVSRDLGFKGRIEQENWIEQAQILARGEETFFSRRLERGETPSARPVTDEGEPKSPVVTPVAPVVEAAPVRSRSGVEAAAAAAAAMAAAATASRTWAPAATPVAATPAVTAVLPAVPAVAVPTMPVAEPALATPAVVVAKPAAPVSVAPAAVAAPTSAPEVSNRAAFAGRPAEPVAAAPVPATATPAVPVAAPAVPAPAIARPGVAAATPATAVAVPAAAPVARPAPVTAAPASIAPVSTTLGAAAVAAASTAAAAVAAAAARSNAATVSTAAAATPIAARAAVAALPAATVPATGGQKPAIGTGRDNLQRVGGINAEVEKLLNVQGISRYSQIAHWGRPETERFDRLLGYQGRISRENWIEQAQILGKGGDTAYSREFDRREAESAAKPGDANPRPTRLAEAIRTNEAKPAEARPRVNDISGLRSVRSEAFRPAETAAPAQARETVNGASRTVRSTVPDDLKRIRGIGVLIEKKLNSMGITNYDQVASWSAGDIERVSQVLDFKGRIERENWVEQARILGAGGQTEFSRRADRGDIDMGRN